MKNFDMKRLVWPVFIELALQMLVGNIDQLMLSGYSDTAVAAVGNANMIMSMVILVFNIISTSTGILVSQSIGANNLKRVGGIYTVAIFVNTLVGIFFTLFLLVSITPIYTMMRVPSELIADATVYINIVALSIPFQAVISTMAAIFRSNALMKITMKISIIYNIINVVGNALLINGVGFFPALGTAGVAVSTVISRIIGAIILWIIFKKAITNATVDFKLLKPFPTEILKDMLKIGLPAGGENLSWNFAQLVALGFINTFGTVSVTARAYVNMLATLSYIYSSACGQAVQVMVGYHTGAKDYDAADKIVKKAIVSSSLIAVSVSIAICIFAKPIYGIFTDNPEILALIAVVSIIEIFLEYARTFNIVYIRALQASGDTIFPIVLGVSTEWLVCVGFGYLFGVVLNMGLVGVWLGFMLDEGIRAVVCHFRWKSGVWRLKSEKINR